mmetsp:Transcript_49562/g.94707  ORF Transcript_49562/g.94707 Transcript_49562/m.94707 type:complete len:207 (+) Transcript_49562:585-1205(+)
MPPNHLSKLATVSSRFRFKATTRTFLDSSSMGTYGKYHNAMSPTTLACRARSIARRLRALNLRLLSLGTWPSLFHAKPSQRLCSWETCVPGCLLSSVARDMVPQRPEPIPITTVLRDPAFVRVASSPSSACVCSTRRPLRFLGGLAGLGFTSRVLLVVCDSSSFHGLGILIYAKSSDARFALDSTSASSYICTRSGKARLRLSTLA